MPGTNLKPHLYVWKILDGQFHEVSVNAPDHSLMGDDQQVIAAIHLRENLRQTPETERTRSKVIFNLAPQTMMSES